MKKYLQRAAAFCFAIVGSLAQASIVEFGDNTNSMVKTVNGAWAYNERLSFSSPGSYSLSFNDLNFADKFEYVGAMISTPTQNLGTIFIENGIASSLTPIEFQVGEQEYWISIFALSSSVYNAGTFGLNFSSLSDIAEVPVPGALVLLLSSLFGLVTCHRSRRNLTKCRRDNSSLLLG